MRLLASMLVLLTGVAFALPTRAVDIERFLRKDAFDDIKISPTGDYFAATVPLEDRTVLVVLRRTDNKVTGTFNLGRNTHVADFVWVNPERVLLAVAEKFGSLDQPTLTGELYAINADGSQAELLVGWRARDGGLGTRIGGKKEELVFARLVDDLPDDDRNVIIGVWPPATDPYARAERMDVYTGRRAPVVRAPVRNARFITDHKGVVRFASGIERDNRRKLYYRAGEGADWQLVSDEAVTGIAEVPIGFSEDDRTAYFIAEQAEGPDRLVAYDVASGTRTPVFGDRVADPHEVLYRHRSLTPIGAVFLDGKGRVEFFDATSAEARLQRSLEAAFAGHAVRVTSRTADGRLALVRIASDRNPGDFYLFDVEAKKADLVVSRRTWIDPETMAEMRPIEFKARDGLTIHGYLTSPRGRAGKAPLVVMPHGGPFGIQDAWGFDPEVQMLAAAGYAVLQVNFRGSSGYGRAFMRAGAQEWGGRMQDDLTDATRWAIEQGHADPQRICMYGGSYGGYASLMGVAKEPALYRCAAGYVGVYDLPILVRDDGKQSRRFGTWSREWIGDASEKLASVSPNRVADRIKVPVFLAAGGEDEIAPIEHTRLMEKALRAAGVSVETLYYPTEGHGFYKIEHRREFYTRLLAFLARHLGGAQATGAAEAAAVGK